MLTRCTRVAVLCQGVVDESENRGECLEIEGLGLPSFNVVDDFRSLLPFAEVD